jgi:hypothetical protein
VIRSPRGKLNAPRQVLKGGELSDGHRRQVSFEVSDPFVLADRLLDRDSPKGAELE